MKTYTIFIAIFFIAISTQNLFSQEFEIPEVKLEKAEDYEKYHGKIIECVNWLENTPITQQPGKRKEAGAFLITWLTGAPNVSVELQLFQTELTKKNPDLLISFLGGWTKFALENPNQKDNVLLGNIAGIHSLIKVYAANKEKGMKKDKKVEKLLKLEKDKLEQWVKKQLE